MIQQQMKPATSESLLSLNEVTRIIRLQPLTENSDLFDTIQTSEISKYKVLLEKISIGLKLGGSKSKKIWRLSSLIP